MKRGKWTGRLACGALVMAVLGGVAFAAGNQGSQSDPLVTLSYLNDVAVPAIMRQVDEKLDLRERALKEELKKGGQPAFAVVEIAAGKTLTLSAGGQLLVRTGNASSNAPLVDTTTGESFRGGALSPNHLYLSTGDGQLVTVSSAATMLIQGTYSVA